MYFDFLWSCESKTRLNMGNSTYGIMSARMRSVKYSSLCFTLLSLMILIGNGQTFDNNNVVLVLESHTQAQHPDLSKYRCTLKTSQIQISKIVNDLIDNDTDHNSSDIEVPLQFYENQQFFILGFNDMCTYIQNNTFNQHYNKKTYQLPMPLLLDNPNDFYNLEQLTDDEISFIKEIESFDNNNNNNSNPFDIDITRMNNLFKLADFLQMERLVTIIAARQASLMMNMNKQQMIDWLIENPTTKKQITTDNNNNNNNNDNNLKMVPLLLSQTQSFGLHDINSKEECIVKYHSALLQHILQFLSCFDINTFSSISDEFYQLANELNILQSTIDPMIKILTNNYDSTCLSLTNREVAFYKPFLTLAQSRWSKNQNDTYDRLKTMPNDKISTSVYSNPDTFESGEGFQYALLACSNLSDYFFMMMTCDIYHNDSLYIHDYNFDEYGRAPGIEPDYNVVSFKFANFAQQVNMFAQSRNIAHIDMTFTKHDLSSFEDLIGINNITNIRKLIILGSPLSLTDFEQIYDIRNQLEHLEISHSGSITNMQFLSKLKSLKYLGLKNNPLHAFDLSVLKELTDLRTIEICFHTLKYTSNTKCVDFSFLNNVPNLNTFDLSANEIQCIDNFMTIQTHSNLETVSLYGNGISSLNLNAFQGTNIKKIHLQHNKLSNFIDNDNATQFQSCLDFNSFDNMKQLQWLDLSSNEIACIKNFESIQQHTQLTHLDLHNNHLWSMIDFTKFEDSKPLMNSLKEVNLADMNLTYTIHNDDCLDLKFLEFMPNTRMLDLSKNKIECVDNVSILQRQDINLERLYLDSNNLTSFDLADLIGSNIQRIDLSSNGLSFESLKNFDNDTLSKISPGKRLSIYIYGKDDIIRYMWQYRIWIY